MKVKLLHTIGLVDSVKLVEVGKIYTVLREGNDHYYIGTPLDGWSKHRVRRGWLSVSREKLYC